MAISIDIVSKFDQLSVKEAYDTLHNIIVPACKEKGIQLSVYYGTNSINSVKKYNKQKKIDTLCNVEKVQKIFSFLDKALFNNINQSINLYQVRNIIKRNKGEIITKAECIAAMLVKGYIADFTVDGGKLGINCDFYIKLNK